MREAIERVIAELEAQAMISAKIVKNKWADQREYHDGREDGFILAIDKLKAVLAEHETGDTGNTPKPE